MNVWKRCALLEGHAGPCAAWVHLRDEAKPRGGVRCGSLVEPRVEHFQRPITGRQMRVETTRREIVAQTRESAARHGYTGRVSFVALDVTGARDHRLYAVRVHPALGGP